MMQKPKFLFRAGVTSRVAFAVVVTSCTRWVNDLERFNIMVAEESDPPLAGRESNLAMVEMILSGEIIDYIYDRTLQRLVKHA